MYCDIDRKPTAHVQKCFVCHKEIKKGNLRLIMRANSYRETQSLYAHPHCMVGWIKTSCKGISSMNQYGYPIIKINPSRRKQKVQSFYSPIHCFEVE